MPLYGLFRPDTAVVVVGEAAGANGLLTGPHQPPDRPVFTLDSRKHQPPDRLVLTLDSRQFEALSSAGSGGW